MNELLNYFSGDELASNVWEKKYKDNEEKTPDEMHLRMAKKLAEIEQVYNKFDTEKLSDIGQKFNHSFSEEFIYNQFKKFKYIVPQGSIMSTLGTNKAATLSNCYVVDSPKDSLGGIFKSIEEMGQMYKRRGGVGIDLSSLRPRNSKVNNAAKSSTGAVSFAEIISKTGSIIGADNRRAATMISINISHPDVEEFIKIKTQLGKIDSANLSVKIDKNFWFCYKDNLPYMQYWSTETEIKNISGIPDNYELNKLYEVTVNDKSTGYVQFINPKSIIKLIAESAWKSAEPGMLYWDRVIEYSPDGVYPQYTPITTNPCMVGETLVLTNIGWISFNTLYEKKYDNIKIITRNKDGEFYNSDLKDVMLTKKDAILFKSSFDNGEFLLTNEEHKFYDEKFNEINILNLNGKRVISGNGLVKCIDVEKLNLTQDVFDLTAAPNFNFFSILNREEIVILDKIIINDNLHFDYCEIVNTNKGQVFAWELTKEHELI